MSNNIKQQKHKITIDECDWNDSEYRTKKWEQSIDMKEWVHDFENKIYIITWCDKQE